MRCMLLMLCANKQAGQAPHSIGCNQWLMLLCQTTDVSLEKVFKIASRVMVAQVPFWFGMPKTYVQKQRASRMTSSSTCILLLSKQHKAHNKDCHKHGFPTLRYGSLGSAISSQLAGVMT